jgi:hypothetical protein
MDKWGAGHGLRDQAQATLDAIMPPSGLRAADRDRELFEILFDQAMADYNRLEATSPEKDREAVVALAEQIRGLRSSLTASERLRAVQIYAAVMDEFGDEQRKTYALRMLREAFPSGRSLSLRERQDVAALGDFEVLTNTQAVFAAMLYNANKGTDPDAEVVDVCTSILEGSREFADALADARARVVHAPGTSGPDKVDPVDRDRLAIGVLYLRGASHALRRETAAAAQDFAEASRRSVGVGLGQEFQRRLTEANAAPADFEFQPYHGPS